MDIEKICINNLGKEVDYDSFKGMVVGYNILLERLILSFVEDIGWNTIEYTDIILLRSPLNRSYAFVYPKNYKEQLIL
jgi:hypothetical protein